MRYWSKNLVIPVLFDFFCGKICHPMKPVSLSFLLALLMISFSSLHAGGLRGVVRSAGGSPLAFATIFVTETGTGTTTNAEGAYEIRLDPGDYTVVFRFLGYRSETRRVAIGESFKELDVVLEEQPIQLTEVQVFAGDENPAYTIMRKAIAKASYHRQQIDRYTAEVYIKGSGRLLKSPFFLRKMIEKEGVDSTKAFTSESVSLIEYERPGTFRERVISVYQSGDANDTSPNSFIFSSFYEPEIAGAISPLSPKAFAYYKFEYEGFFMDRDYGVNRIRVIPRSRGENVFEGTIYIVEDWWSIYNLSLKTYKFGFGFQIDQTYAPIEHKAWLPVSHQIFVDGSIFGFAFEYKYLSTISNYDIELNPDLDDDFTVIDEKLNRELAAELKKQQEQEDENAGIHERLSSGQELTRKELRRLMREYEREERRRQEEPEVISETEYTVDSMAHKRDSAYWAEIRPVPLTNYEVRGYEWQDSVAVAEKAEAEGEEGGKSKSGGYDPFTLITGDRYKVADKSYLFHESFLDKILFNPVEGWNIHNEIGFRQRGDHPFSLALTPRYAFSRKKFTGKGSLTYGYGGQLLESEVRLEGGRYIYQYNENNPIDFHFSAFVNLVNGRNYIRLYEKDFAALSWRHQLRENWQLNAGAEWARRFTLENMTSQTWFGGDREGGYNSNLPDSEEFEGPFPETQDAFFFTLGIEARPWQKYRIRNDRKEPIEHTSPTIGLTYRKGLPGFLDSEVNYDRLDLLFRHHFDVGYRGTMDVKMETGIFLNDQEVGFPDFRHFMGNRIALVSADPVGSFRLLDYYRHSSRDKWAAVHVHYQFRKFLFTQIPELWLLGLKENLFVNYLATPTSQNYFEVGYSLDNILRFLRLETAVAFQDGKYYDWGVLIGIASNLGDIFD
jgi:ribosomal protein L19